MWCSVENLAGDLLLGLKYQFSQHCSYILFRVGRENSGQDTWDLLRVKYLISNLSNDIEVQFPYVLLHGA